ncbi:autotransporter [Opitutaceae bacterium TAV5]|nr:autotransporter [Opitutaceae bacterium TAV5]
MKSPSSSFPVPTTPASGVSLATQFTTAALLGAICLTLQPSTQAATALWSPSGASTNLGGATNWSPSVIPGTTDEVLFSSVTTNLTTADALTWGNLIWNADTSTTISISNTPSSNKLLTLSGGGGSTAAIASGGQTGDLLLLGNNMTNGTLTISGTPNQNGARLIIALGNDGAFNVKNTAATLIITSEIRGNNVNLAKTGAGTLTLSGANTFGTDAGKTFTIFDGTVNANSATSLGRGDVILAGGRLTINEAATGSINIRSGKTFSMSGGTLSFSFENTSSHDQIVSLGGNVTFGITGGTIDLTNSISDYSVTYTLFKDFGSGSIADLQIINYDTANYTASLGSNGVLSFMANTVPEPSTWAAITGGLALALATLRRRVNARKTSET